MSDEPEYGEGILLDLWPESERPNFLHIRRERGTPWGITQIDQRAWVVLWYDRDDVPDFAPAKRTLPIVAYNPTPEGLAALLPQLVPPDVALRLSTRILAARTRQP
jgi:hypothetical protein